MKTFVIGDVHGSYDQLQNLLNKIRPNLRQDRLVMLGDYIDRGPDSYLTVRSLMELQNTFDSSHVALLRGNHEQMAIDFIQDGCSAFLWNGGEKTLKDFGRNGDDLANYISFFKTLPPYFEDEHFVYVHGGIRPGISLCQQAEEDLLWLREEFYLNPMTGEKTVIFGHTPTCNINGTWHPFITDGCIGIDTGCV